MHFFDRVYEGTPPWEIGHPQGEILRLEEAGEITGRVLDIGCGTGENALYLAGRRHEVWGVDFSHKAVEKARSKPVPSNGSVRFEVASALELPTLHETFDTVLDCGLFHTFLDPHRPVYAAGVKSVLRPGGRFFVFCFSEKEPLDWGGPRRVTREELRTTFGEHLEERWIREAHFETILPSAPGHAWLGAFGVPAVPPGRPVRSRQPHPPSRGGIPP